MMEFRKNLILRLITFTGFVLNVVSILLMYKSQEKSQCNLFEASHYQEKFVPADSTNTIRMQDPLHINNPGYFKEISI